MISSPPHRFILCSKRKSIAGIDKNPTEAKTLAPQINKNFILVNKTRTNILGIANRSRLDKTLIQADVSKYGKFQMRRQLVCSGFE